MKYVFGRNVITDRKRTILKHGCPNHNAEESSDDGPEVPQMHDDDNIGERVHRRDYAAGSQNLHTEPPPARGLIRIHPPCASTILRHTAKPRPGPGYSLP